MLILGTVSEFTLPQLTRQSVGMLAAQVSGIGLAYVVQILLARWMGVDAFGSYTYVLAWASTVALVTGLGFPAAVLRFVPEYQSREASGLLRGFLRRSAQLTLATSTALSLAATAAILLVDHGGAAERTLLLLGAWIVPPLAFIRLQTETLRAARHLTIAYLPTLLARPALVAAGAYLLLDGDGQLTGWGAMAATLGATMAIILVRIPWMRHSLGRQTPDARAQFDTRVWLKTSTTLLLVPAFLFVINQADLLMVGLLIDETSVGIYRVAARSAAFATLALVAVNTATAPLIASTFKKDGPEGLQKLVTWSVHLIFWPSLALAALLLIAGGWLLGLFGKAFAAGYPILAILTIGHLVNAITGPVGYLLNLTGFQTDSARVYGWAASANIVLSLAGIQLFGMTGAAIATAASVAMSNIWLYLLVRRRLGVSASLR